MGISATFAVTESPYNRLRKEFKDTRGTEVRFKSPCSLTSPVILCDISSWTADYAWMKFNYVSLSFTNAVPAPTRYYFITDSTVISEDIVQFTLREDVLATYYDSIISHPLFVERSSVQYNRSIRDSLAVKCYLPRTDEPIDTYTLPYHSPTAVQSGVTDMREKGLTVQNAAEEDTRFVVVVARSGKSNLSPDSPVGLPPLRNSLLKGLFDTDSSSAYVYCCGLQTLQALIENCKSSTSHAESIVSIFRYPYNVPHGSNKLTTIRLGGDDVSVSTTEDRSTFYWCGSSSLLLADFDWRGDKIYYSDYTWMLGDDSFRFYLPYVGHIDINPSVFVSGDEIQIVYVPLYMYGITLVAVCDVSADMLLYASETNIAQEIPITNSNAQQIKDRWISTGIKVGVGTLTDVLKIASGNALMEISGINGIAKNIASVATTALTTHNVTKTSLSSANTSSMLPYKTYLEISKTQYIGYGDNDYKMRFGIPRMSNATLKNLQSSDSDVFVKTDIQYLPSEIGNDAERKEIISLLNGGVLIPKK